MLDEVQVRKEKLEKLRALGMDPYPRGIEKGDPVVDVIEPFTEGRSVTTAGRLMTIRVHGAMMFADLMDETGKVQIAFKEDEIDAESFIRFRDLVDPGDVVKVEGTLFLTKRGEKSVQVKQWHMLAKALLPLPEKWHGLKDVEARYRQRELDLISNPEVRQRFVVRSKLVSSLRHFLDERGFLEVETPILQAIPGGANARPFNTHHNTLGIDLYLRIAPELYLKRLIVGGFEKVYEIGRSFRNEGIDYAHNPEFTTIELYWAYVDKDKFVDFLEEVMVFIVQSATDTLTVPYEDGEISFTAPWPRRTFRESIIEACGIDIDTLETPAEVKKASQDKGLEISFDGCIGLGEHYDELFKKTARPALKQPTWIFDYPLELKPLANKSAVDPTKSASVQLVVQGAEIINAYYYELNDPMDQRERFAGQQALREKGSEEAQWMDEDFIRALEHGMPPTSGMAIGIDRLAAFITNSPNLKEIILFPTLRPTHQE